jgi:2-oxoglutarate dehydrogenase E1 component
MTPKSLLRNVNAGSSLSDLAEGRFQPIINDADAVLHAETITRLVLCSGKVYVDLKYAKPNTTDVREEYAAASNSVAVARIEELYPFPADELREVIAGYPNLQEIVWLQEEPCNQGAWTYIAPRIRELADWSGELTYVGRPESASPAEGSIRRHKIEQARILATALASPPNLPTKVRRVAQAR